MLFVTDYSGDSLATEVKIQPSASLSRTAGSTSVVRLCKNEDHKTSQPVSKVTKLFTGIPFCQTM